MLVSVAVFMLLMVILLMATNQTSSMWRRTTAKIEQFRESRDAFEAVTRRLSQATLNTYWDYDDPATPTRYVRQSELRFLSGKTEALAGAPTAPRRWPACGVFFQAPLGFTQKPSASGTDPALGLENLLNTWGYFIEFGSDAALRPAILGTQNPPLRYRYRLCELMQPSGAFTLYQQTSGLDPAGKPLNLSYSARDWFSGALAIPDASRPVHVLADNVIALIVLPKLSVQDDPGGARLAPSYLYDSTATNADPTVNPKNQLPPVVQVTLVAIDEATAKRLDQGPAMPDLGLDSLFSSASALDADLKTLQATLVAKHANYRVFTMNVSMRGARWSREEAN